MYVSIYIYIAVYVHKHIYVYIHMYMYEDIHIQRGIEFVVATYLGHVENLPLRGPCPTTRTSKWVATAARLSWVQQLRCSPRPSKVALLRALRFLLDGTWGILKGSWGVLAVD